MRVLARARALSLLALVAAAPPRGPAPPVADATLAQKLTVAAPPGDAAAAVLRVLLGDYARATSLALGDAGWDGSEARLRAILAAHVADLVLLDGAALAAACAARGVDKLDWAALGRDRFVSAAASDCGAGAFISSTLLAWDTDKLAGAPGWGDFWDVARHPGRRGLRRVARGNLEIALMADGVAPGDVYRVLRSAGGLDRAFRKLDQLKPYIVWWDRADQPLVLLATAKVLMTTAPANAPRPAGRAHLGTQWTGNLWEVTSLAQPAGAAHARGAVTALLIASDPARQAAFARAMGLGPATLRGFDLLPAAARADSPAAPGHLAAGLAEDGAFWAEAGEKLEQRFAAWAAR